MPVLKDKKSAEAQPRKQLFRVVRGLHVEGRWIDPEDGREKPKVYRRGDIVNSSTDLVQRHNTTNSVKFERVSVDEAAAVADAARQGFENGNTALLDDDISAGDGLDGMSLSELKAVAAEEGIDLGTATSKKAITQIVRETMEG